MDVDSLPHFIIIMLALALIIGVIFAVVLNINVLEGLSSTMIFLSRNIFSSLSF